MQAWPGACPEYQADNYAELWETLGCRLLSNLSLDQRIHFALLMISAALCG